MLKLRRIFKNYEETGSFNEQVNLYGFVDSHVFLTKTGDLKDDSEVSRLGQEHMGIDKPVEIYLFVE